MADAVCKMCGVAFKRKPCNGLTFCSRQCSGAHKAAVAQIKRPVVVTVVRCKCKVCGVRYEGSIASQYCSDRCRYRGTYATVEGTAAACKTCGAEFVRSSTGGRSHIYCSDDCKRTAKRRATKLQDKKREAMMRGAAAYEAVDPIKVFDRDGWLCCICGTDTPRHLRGTCEPNAPELDHVSPIAAGGAHTYDNTQCACRACNGWKGDKMLAGMMGCAPAHV